MAVQLVDAVGESVDTSGVLDDKLLLLTLLRWVSVLALYQREIQKPLFDLLVEPHDLA